MALSSLGGLSCLIWSITPWRSWAIWAASLSPWPAAANCSIDELASAQAESACAMNSVLPSEPCVVSVGTTIGVSGELSPPQAESTTPAPTATARTTKCLTRHIRPRKVARI